MFVVGKWSTGKKDWKQLSSIYRLNQEEVDILKKNWQVLKMKATELDKYSNENFIQFCIKQKRFYWTFMEDY